MNCVVPLLYRATPRLEALLEEVCAYPNVAALGGWHDAAELEEPTLLVPLRFAVDGVELSLFSTLTKFGTPQDVTLSELAIEMFFPAGRSHGGVLPQPRNVGTRPRLEATCHVIAIGRVRPPTDFVLRDRSTKYTK